MSSYGGDDYDGGYGGNRHDEDSYSGGRDHGRRSNQGGGEASSYYNSNDDFNSGGRGDGRGYGQVQQNGYGGGNAPHGGDYGGGGRYGADDDLSGAVSHANQHAGSSGDSNIYSSVLSALSQNKHSIGNQNIDEQDAVQSHQQYFGGVGSGQQASSGSMGSAAAMQALKMFSGGGSGNSQQGNSQNAFIGMAMAEASKLFDNQSSQGNVQSSASKESAVQQAGEIALKMWMKSQGGSGGGGASGLIGLASKFL